MHHFLRLHNTGCKTQEDFVELRSYFEKNQRKTNKKASHLWVTGLGTMGKKMPRMKTVSRKTHRSIRNINL